MNKTTRVLLVSMMSVAVLTACSKKVKEAPPAPAADTAPTAPTAPATSGLYGPDDLDTDACLRQRVVYFDFDNFKPFNDRYGFRLGDRAILMFAENIIGV